MFLYNRYLVTGTNFSALHFNFLMGVSTIGTIVRETCEVIWDVLQPTEMSIPTTEDWLDISNAYYEKSQFPNCVGKSMQNLYNLYNFK